MYSDTELMLKVKSGDIDKLGLLFERYKNSLFGYFFRTTGDKAASEDLVQNVFFRILKYRDKFAGYGKFTAWMYHIAHNVRVDYGKENYVQPDVVDISELMLADDTATDEPVIKEERLRLLNEAMRRLTDAERELIVLSKYQELKYKEIGRVLGCSEGAVKVRIFRAICRLKDLYLTLEQ